MKFHHLYKGKKSVIKNMTAKKKISRIKIQIATILLFLQGFIISDAYAYLDPGSGSIVIQAIIGALVGVGITVKIYGLCGSII